jgi:uncharacterized membrane protein
MFRPEKDERLWRIEQEAAMTALITYFFLILGLMIVRGFVDVEVLSDPAFLLVVPWLVTGLVFFTVEWKKGFYTVVREENTRTRERLRNTRSSLLLSIVSIAVLMFVIKRLQLFSDSAQSLTEDLTDAGGFALIWGVIMWFLTARKSKAIEE